MTFRIILLKLVMAVAFAVASSPTWTTSSNIKAGSQTFVSTTLSTATTYYTGSFPAAFTTSSIRCVPGIIDYQLNTATGNYFSYQSDFNMSGAAGYQFYLSLYNGTEVNSWRSSYFCYDYSFITYISSARSSTSYSSSDAVNSGSGYRFYKAPIGFSTGAIDMTHAVYIMPFISRVVLYRPSISDNFIFKVTLEIVDSTTYNRIHATDGNCLLSSASQYRITYDQTAVQATKKTYLDAQFFTGNNSTPNPYSLVFSDPTNYHSGINHFDFSGTVAPKFSYDPVTFTLTSTGYVFLNLSTINYRYRSCASPTVYFMESENLCYDVCPSGFFPEGTNLYCSPCSPGCLSCTDSSSSSCSTCNTTANRTLSGSSCPCATSLYDSGVTQCQPCSATCYSCNNTATNCTACRSDAFRTQSGNSCPCDSGYIETGNTACGTCGSAIAGCLACTSATICTACNSTQFMVLSHSSCVCAAGYVLVSGTCNACNSTLVGCTQCSSTAVCTVCDASAHFTLSASTQKCACQTGFFSNSSTNACDSCSAAIAGCTQCSSSTVCTQCVAPLAFVSGRCQCSDIHQYYNQSQAACVDCKADCNTCSNGSACLTCNSSLFRVLNSTTGDCVCGLGYQQDANGLCVSLGTCVNGFVYNGTACQEICGDGLLFELDCDDGNLQSGDGCSAACNVEANFTCRGGSGSSASKCSYNQPLQLSLAGTKRDLYANAINFTFRVVPELKILTTFNYSQILSSSLPTSSIEASYTNGLLTVRVVYQQSIQNTSASLNVAPPTSLDNTFEMKASSASFVVDPDNAQAYYYSEGTFASATAMTLVLKICTGVAFAVLVLGIGFWKLVGIEAMHVMQILFVASILVASLPPPLAPASELWPALGYNNMFTDFPRLYDFGTPELPKTLIQMQMGARFVQNCNYMIAGQLLVVLVGGIFFLLSKAVTKYNEPLLKVAKFVLVDILMVLILFNCVGVGFSIGLHILYWNRSQIQPIQSQFINLVPAVVVLVMAAVHFWLMYKHSDYFQSTNKTLKHDKLSQMHPAVLFSARFLTGLTLSVLSELKYGVIAPAGIQLIFLVFVIAKRPYRKVVVSIRAIINESVVGVIFLVAIVYNFYIMSAQTMARSSWEEFIGAPAWVETALVIATILFNLVCQIYAIYKATCRKKEVKVKVEAAPSKQELPAQSSLRQGEIVVEKPVGGAAVRQLEVSRDEFLDIGSYNAQEKKSADLRDFIMLDEIEP